MNPTINIASTMSKLFAVTSWALAALLTAGCTSGGEAQPTPATEARATSATSASAGLSGVCARGPGATRTPSSVASSFSGPKRSERMTCRSSASG